MSSADQSAEAAAAAPAPAATEEKPAADSAAAAEGAEKPERKPLTPEEAAKRKAERAERRKEQRKAARQAAREAKANGEPPKPRAPKVNADGTPKEKREPLDPEAAAKKKAERAERRKEQRKAARQAAREAKANGEAPKPKASAAKAEPAKGAGKGKKEEAKPAVLEKTFDAVVPKLDKLEKERWNRMAKANLRLSQRQRFRFVDILATPSLELWRWMVEDCDITPAEAGTCFSILQNYYGFTK